MRVAFYGLSGNPPTGDLGHRGIVKYLVSSGLFDQILIAPVYQHIFQAKSNLINYSDRRELCRLNFCDLSSNVCEVVVSDAEKELFLATTNKLQSQGLDCQNYRQGTVDVLDFLQSLHPSTQFHLVLGFDTFFDLIRGKWKHSDRIVLTYSLEVISRSSSNGAFDVDQTISTLLNNQRPFRITFHPFSNNDNPTSSTLARSISLTDLPSLSCYESFWKYGLSSLLSSLCPIFPSTNLKLDLEERLLSLYQQRLASPLSLHPNFPPLLTFPVAHYIASHRLYSASEANLIASTSSLIENQNLIRNRMRSFFIHFTLFVWGIASFHTGSS